MDSKPTFAGIPLNPTQAIERGSFGIAHYKLCRVMMRNTTKRVSYAGFFGFTRKIFGTVANMQPFISELVEWGVILREQPSVRLGTIQHAYSIANVTNMKALLQHYADLMADQDDTPRRRIAYINIAAFDQNILGKVDQQTYMDAVANAQGATLVGG